MERETKSGLNLWKKMARVLDKQQEEDKGKVKECALLLLLAKGSVGRQSKEASDLLINLLKIGGSSKGGGACGQSRQCYSHREWFAVKVIAIFICRYAGHARTTPE